MDVHKTPRNRVTSKARPKHRLDTFVVKGPPTAARAVRQEMRRLCQTWLIIGRLCSHAQPTICLSVAARLKGVGLLKETLGYCDPLRGRICIATGEMPLSKALELGSADLDDSILGVLRHELAHILFQYWRELRLRWAGVFRGVGRKAFGRVSLYATLSTQEEAFAECFCAYTHPGYRKGLPKRVERFLKEVLDTPDAT